MYMCISSNTTVCRGSKSKPSRATQQRSSFLSIPIPLFSPHFHFPGSIGILPPLSIRAKGPRGLLTAKTPPKHYYYHYYYCMYFHPAFFDTSPPCRPSLDRIGTSPLFGRRDEAPRAPSQLPSLGSSLCSSASLHHSTPHPPSSPSTRVSFLLISTTTPHIRESRLVPSCCLCELTQHTDWTLPITPLRRQGLTDLLSLL